MAFNLKTHNLFDNSYTYSSGHTEELSDDVLCQILRYMTGYSYRFVVTPVRKWGDKGADLEESETGFYQIFPDEMDDGFFEWYTSQHPYRQFYQSKSDCMLNFIHFWHQYQATKLS